jgi:hypothetical protein
LERFFRAAAQLTSQQQRHHAAPPPGREVEVSIEPDERSTFLRLRQGDVLLVDDSERQLHAKIDPSGLGIQVGHLDRDRPGATERLRCEVEGLAGLDRPRRLG